MSSYGQYFGKYRIFIICPISGMTGGMNGAINFFAQLWQGATVHVVIL